MNICDAYPDATDRVAGGGSWHEPRPQLPDTGRSHPPRAPWARDADTVDPRTLRGSALARLGAVERAGVDVEPGDYLRHYAHGSTLVCARVLDVTRAHPADGHRTATVDYGEPGAPALRRVVLDDHYPYKLVDPVGGRDGDAGAVRVELAAYGAAAALAFVPVVVVLTFVARLAGTVAALVA